MPTPAVLCRYRPQVDQAPRHARKPDPLPTRVARFARELVWDGDTVLLVALGLGVLVWPWLGWVAAAGYVALVGVVSATLWLVVRRR